MAATVGPRTSSGTRSSSTTSPGSWRARTKGEGLGNKFLANIRETRRAAARRARPPRRRTSSTPRAASTRRRDIETIETELLLRRPRARPSAATRASSATPARGDRAAVAEEEWLRQVIEALQAGRPARAVPVPARRARRRCATSRPLTGKPVLFVANVDEGDDAVPAVVADHAAADGRGGGGDLLPRRGRAVRARRRGGGDDARGARRSASPACTASSTAPSACST